MSNLDQVIAKISHSIINPFLALLFALGVLIFIFGVVEFMVALSNADTSKRKTGIDHMIWGLVGMTIMASAYAILNIIANTVCTGGLANCIQ